jgi:hypothetical protein
VSDVPVHFAPDEVSADVAASALRVAGLHPRVALDDAGPLLGVVGISSLGRRIVLVPQDEVGRARRVLREPTREEREDQPLLRFVIIAGLITGLTLIAALLAGSC